MATISETVSTLITTLTEALHDAEKHDAGNNAAGGRLRKSLQSAATTCKNLRKTVQDERNVRKS
jgi:hypothetical protein